jgi:hypothetical protein
MTALSPNIFAKPVGGSVRSARPRLTNAIMADRAAVAAAEIATPVIEFLPDHRRKAPGEAAGAFF